LSLKWHLIKKVIGEEVILVALLHDNNIISP